MPEFLSFSVLLSFAEGDSSILLPLVGVLGSAVVDLVGIRRLNGSWKVSYNLFTCLMIRGYKLEV